MIYDNGSEFKLPFKELCDSYQLKHKPTSVNNPQVKAILEQIHGVLADMMQMSCLDMSETVDSDAVNTFIISTA